MSKAFTKESDGALDDELAAPDLSLPPGIPNYVTPTGLSALRGSIEALRDAAAASPPDRRRAIERRLGALIRRLEAAQVIDPAAQPEGRVLFGTTVTVRDEAGEERRYRVVGVDEVDVRRGWVSWLSPVARALIDHRVGDVVMLRTPRGEEELEVVAIEH